ncbi:MAG: DMT family transporter [Paracoccaceae bacterium]
MKDSERQGPSLAIGYFAILTSVLIWAGWIVAVRDAMVTKHAPLDIALLRYGAPAILLAPYWLRKGVFPKGESPLMLIIMTLGWGGPFVLMISQGMKTVDASLFGPLVPGLLPMVVALWGYVVEGDTMRLGRLLGLGFIAAAVVLVLGPAVAGGDPGLLAGAPWLVCACFGWSAFTIAFRRTNLSGIEAAAYVCLYSTPFLLVAAMIAGTGLFEYPARELAFQVTVQGVLSGAISVGFYGYAVRTLGLASTASFTCLVPVLAAIGGLVMLGETVGPAGWAASASACVGVLLVNRFAR